MTPWAILTSALLTSETVISAFKSNQIREPILEIPESIQKTHPDSDPLEPLSVTRPQFTSEC